MADDGQVVQDGGGTEADRSASPGVAATTAPAVDSRLEAVLDVDLPLVVRFGATSLPLRTLAALGSGSMVDLNRAPEDPVELLVGDRVIARGDVVVISGQYGVRITELIKQARPAAAAVEH
jgi:flagellar motor switch protein FliN